jgi:hypothetical protein
MPFPNGATFSADYDGRTGLLKLLTTTFNASINQNVSGLFWGPLARGALKSAWWFEKNSVVKSTMTTIRADLTDRGLLAER